MTTPRNAATSLQQLMPLINGYRVSQAIHVAAALGIADVLSNGPKTVGELAASTHSHEPSLYRVLRSLSAHGVFTELPERRFRNNDVSETLRADAPISMYGYAILIGRPYHWQGWGNLHHSVTTGESGVRRVTGMDTWRFREENPEEGAIFDRAMTDLSRAFAESILDAYNFGQFKRIADIAGGQGAQLAAILARYSGTTGVLFDQPHVVSGSTETLSAAGVEDRCEIVGGSFFDAVPPADAYILKQILHDWDDADCVRILRTLRKAAPDGARLLVIERVVGPANQDPDTTLSDLNMLVGPGGQERTREEFAELFNAGGWRLIDLHGAGSRYVIEGVLA